MRRTRIPDRTTLPRILPLVTLLFIFIAVVSACGGSGDDLAGILEPSSSSELDELEVTPAEAFLLPGEEQQFSVEARDADGEATPVTVDWTARGGTIDDAGLFTAGPEAGEFAVIATHVSGLEAEAAVTIGEADPGDGDPGDRAPDLARECESPASGWIWCDDFEVDRLDAYFEYDDDGGEFVPRDGLGVEGSTGMRVRFQAGEQDAGDLHLAFGRTPSSYFDPVDAGTADYREIYWRVYVKHEADWTGGGGNKLSRAMSFVDSNWAQAMIAHAWSGDEGESAGHLYLDPASGTDESGTVQTTTYNDFDNLRWLGSVRSETPLFDADHVGRWYCVEVHVRWNDSGQSNGIFELWIDGSPEASRTDLNWVGDYDDYGMNAVFLENYWNAGSPQTQERYFDNFVVSTERIGC